MSEETQQFDPNATVEIEGSQLTLGQLLGFDLGDTKEVRGFRMPVGSYLFEGGKFQLRTAEIDVKDEATDVEVKKTVPVIFLPSKVLHVYAMTFRDPADVKGEEDIIGKQYGQTYFIRKGDDMGRLKAHLTDVGIPSPKGVSLEQLLSSYEGHKWVGRVIHTPNKNDPDRPYVNLKDGSVKPASQEQVAQAAPIPEEAA